MIGQGTAHFVRCHVVDCKVTGAPPAQPGRPFVCTKHLKVCHTVSLSDHARAAAQLIACRKPIDPDEPELQRQHHRDRVRIAEKIEAQAWGMLQRQVAAKFEVQS